jgi:hypothetical protein
MLVKPIFAVIILVMLKEAEIAKLGQTCWLYGPVAWPSGFKSPSL